MKLQQALQYANTIKTAEDIPEIDNDDGYTGITYVTDQQEIAETLAYIGATVDEYPYMLAILTYHGEILGAWAINGYHISSRAQWYENPHYTDHYLPFV